MFELWFVVQWLMTQPASPIIDFYPLDFQLDMEGKRQDWEAVVLLKFIDVPRLRQAESCVLQQQLSAEELARNKPGPLLHFRYDPGCLRSCAQGSSAEDLRALSGLFPSRVINVAQRCLGYRHQWGCIRC